MKKDDELRNIAPDLMKVKRDDGFTTPHNYFKELPERVISRINEQERARPSIWHWLQSVITPRYALAFASVVILIVAGVWLTNTEQAQDHLVSITPDEALDYVMDNLHEFSSEDLLAVGLLTDLDVNDAAPVAEDDLDEMIELMKEEGMIDELMIN